MKRLLLRMPTSSLEANTLGIKRNNYASRHRKAVAG
jgi:hypothetical protein